MKSNLVYTFLTITAIGLFSYSSLPGATQRVSDPVEAIEEDYRSGVITLDDRILAVLTFLKTPEKLPLKYRQLAAAQPRSESRMITFVLRDAFVHWNELLPETRESYALAMARPSGAFTYISPSGYFKLHYNTGGTHQVPLADTNFNSIPDFVEKCAAYCDTTLTTYDQWGFLRPPNDGSLGGDTLFDVYFENMGAYGYTLPETDGPESWNDASSYLVLNSDFLGFPPNNDPEGDQYGAAKVTVAHEFHHCVQFAYDYNEDLWFMESDATAWEDIVFDASDDNYNFLGTFFASPQTSLHANTSHAYSCFIWELFLAQNFDTSILVSIWEGARFTSVYNATSDSLQQIFGWTQDSAFGEFVAWNYCTAARDDGLHHGEAGLYPSMTIARVHSIYPVSSISSPVSPAGYGSAYIEFYPSEDIGTLRLTFNGSDATDWNIVIDKSFAADVHEFEKVTLNGVDKSGTIEVPVFESYSRVTLIAANVSEFGSSAGFTYSATVIPPYAVSSAVVTQDSAVYSGGERAFQYEVTNPSPLNDVYDVWYWDDSGWIAPDTITRAIGTGASNIIEIPVTPPTGTPLGHRSLLHFAVRSLNLSTVTDSQTTEAETVLQRGDSDFSGQINVADLTYLVAYVFVGGPQPIPDVLAADFDCHLDVNVADITGLVGYLFQGGGPPPCNPY